MAAYGALVSVMHIIEQLKQHPRPPITIHKQQAQSLTEKIAFLQDFLEVYNSHYSNQEVERLRSRIADAAYAAEDIIESHIVDQIHCRSTNHFRKGAYAEAEDKIESTSTLAEEKMCCNNLYQRLKKVKKEFVQRHIIKSTGIRNAAEHVVETHVVDQIHAESTISHDRESIGLYKKLHEVIEDMNSIKKEVMEIKEKIGNQEQLQGIIATPFVSSKSFSTQHNTMVGFVDVLIGMLDKLTGQSSDRQIIPIVGMGGIGKTTLARNVYENQLIVEYFDVRAWVTVSQENTKLILLEILCQKNQGYRKTLSEISEAELGEKLYKSLCGRRYLIVMDDMWHTDVWDKVKFFFPNESNGSRIIVTTRLAHVASYLTTNCGLEMDFLDQDESWSLFCKTVFGKEDCPHELEEAGKKIAENLKGLPLSIVVLGGVLAKSKQTREYWEYVLQNLISIVNLGDNERCLKILQTSYEQLPVHLKVCFLYMGTFSEDSEIRVSELINTWVAEGFLKPISGESLEESGKKYLIDLVDRNLILVSGLGDCGNIKFCGIHDLLRDLCLREARKEKFLYVSNQHSLNSVYTQRRIAIHEKSSDEEYLHSLKTGSAVRSLICDIYKELPLFEARLLRVLKMIGISKYTLEMIGSLIQTYTLEDYFQLVNLRYLDCFYDTELPIFRSVYLLWNLQTLFVHGLIVNDIVAPPEIWKMPLLRHVKSDNLKLPDPPSGHIDSLDEFGLRNLQSLSGIHNLKFTEEVIKRTPNVKKLKIFYSGEDKMTTDYCLNNLGCLDKLESLYLNIFYTTISGVQNLTFPHSLKKLSLVRTELNWEDISTKIGSLPLLQVLKLKDGPIRGSEWETVEGQFCSLKYLKIGSVDFKYWSDLEYWITESTHFPCLESLFLKNFGKLKEIPTDIGEIPTLKSIKLHYCSDSSVTSAKMIEEEQKELGNEGLLVRVRSFGTWEC